MYSIIDNTMNIINLKYETCTAEQVEIDRKHEGLQSRSTLNGTNMFYEIISFVSQCLFDMSCMHPCTKICKRYFCNAFMFTYLCGGGSLLYN